MTEDAPKRNKGGRPAKYPGEGRRPTLSLRVRAGLYEKLQKVAAQSDRTISEEMEYRLLLSFEINQLFREFEMASVGGEANHSIGIKFASILYDLQINSDNLGGDRNWTRERTKALVEEKGASEMIPALLAHFPFPSDMTPYPEDVRREEERERTRKLHEQKTMQPTQK